MVLIFVTRKSLSKTLFSTQHEVKSTGSFFAAWEKNVSHNLFWNPSGLDELWGFFTCFLKEGKNQESQ